MGGAKVSVRALLSEPSPSDWERLEARLLEEGEDPKSAAEAVGHTLSAFRRQDGDRQRSLLLAAREARADLADQRLDRWALDEDASDQVKLYWHRYHATRAGRAQELVEVVNPDPLGIREMSLEERLAIRAQIVADRPDLVAIVGSARRHELAAGTPGETSAEVSRDVMALETLARIKDGGGTPGTGEDPA